MTTEEREETVDNKLELLKYTSQVQSRIKEEITSDFILAKLSDKDKEAIIELTADAYFSKRVVDEITTRARKWIWNKKTKSWENTEISKEDKERILKIGNKIFDAYMIKLQMTALVNRNVDKNYLINILAQQQENNTEEPEKVTIANKPKELIANEEQIQN